MSRPLRVPDPPVRPRDGLGARTWWTIVVIGLVGQLAWTVENMYLNVFVYDTISPRPEVIAWMVALSAVAATIGSFVVGAWSDRVARRRVFVSAGYVIWGVCTAAFGLVGHPGAADATGAAVAGAIAAVVALDCVMSFFGSGANDAAFNAWVTDATNPRNRGRVDGTLAVLPLISMLLVFGLLDGLTRAGEWGTFFVIVGAITSAAGVLSWVLVRDRRVPRTEQRVFASIVHGFRASTIRRNPGLYLVFAMVAVVGAASQVFLPYIIIYLQRFLEIEDYALALGIVLIAAAALSVVGGRIMDRVGKERFLLPAAVVFAAGLVAMTFAREFWWVVAAAIVMMTGMMATSAAANAMIRDRTPLDRVGAVQGIRMIAAVMVPMIVGPAIGSAVIVGSGNTFDNLGVIQPVPGPEIFPAAAALLVLLPLLLVALRRVGRTTRPDVGGGADASADSESATPADRA